MIRVEIQESVDRPIEEVFEKLVDIAGYPEWMPDQSIMITCSKDSEGPVGQGTAYTDQTRIGPVHGEVEAFDAPNHVRFHYTARLLGRKVMEGWPEYELESTGDDRTRIRHLAVGRLYGPFKLLRPWVRKMARSERRRTVEALKETLESSGTASDR